MQAVLNFLNSVWPYLVAIICFLFLIIAHEFGHFTAAKICGVKVNEFSVGFGPKLFSFRRGETEYMFKPVLLGGYCALEGENEESENPRAFSNQPPLKRFFILFMGAANNLILGLIVVAVMLSPGNGFVTTTVGGFAENATSNISGLNENDEIIEVNGRHILTSMDLGYTFTNVENGKANIKVKRNGKTVELNSVTFRTEKVEGYNILMRDFTLKGTKKTFLSFIGQTVKISVSYCKIVLWSLVDMICGRFNITDVTGPVGITAVMGEAVKMGVMDFLPLLALLTINLGVMNLLPLPALDGGRLLFVLIELLVGKPVPPKYENAVHTAGFAILFALLILIMGKDIWQIITGTI